MIAIIGAGPIGCFLAYLLAKSGKTVNLYEKHSEIGKPVQCTGLITSEIENILEMKKEFLINTIDRIELFSKNNKTTIELRNKELIIDREKFDKYLAKKSVKAGVNLFLNHRFIDYKNGFVFIKDLKNKKNKKIKTDILIGADGPLSEVAKSQNIFNDRKFYHGIQARVKLKRKKKNYSVYFGEDFPDFFGWVVPENSKVARVGLAAKENSKVFFDNFLNKLKIKKDKIIEMQSGLIPIFNKKNISQKDNVFLIGDAAAQVKATTGGGLVPGLYAALNLAYCILYNKNMKKKNRKINNELVIHLKIREILNKFSDKDYDELIELTKSRKIKNILENESRDFPSRFILKLIFNEPRFLKFLKKI